MRSHPTVNEVARDLSAYIDRVVSRGERFLVMRDRKPVAKLRPVSTEGRPLRELSELLSSLPHLEPEDIDAFESDLADIRHEVGLLPPQDPWGS